VRAFDKWLDEGWSLGRIVYSGASAVVLIAAIVGYARHPHHLSGAWWVALGMAAIALWAVLEMMRWRIRHNRLQRRLTDTVVPPAAPEASQPPAQRVSQGADVPENAAEILTATSEPRVMCPLSPMELTRLFSRGETQLQGESLVAEFKTQWRDVSATVEQVVRQNDYVISVSGKDPDQVTVTFFFQPDPWAARLRGLMSGDPVSAIGQIDLVDQAHVIFNHCALA
jgi:hypothetical protein